MKYLWITPKWPFPISDGARVATTQLLKNLSKRGVKIHLVSFVLPNTVTDPDQAKDELGVSEVSLIQLPNRNRFNLLLSLMEKPFFPITLHAYSSYTVKQQMMKYLNERKYDLLVYDGLHAASWRLEMKEPLLPPFVNEAYRAHNVESDLWFLASKETRNPLKRLLLYLQGQLVRNVEEKLLNEARYVFPVSTIDEGKFKEQVPGASLQTIPIGIQPPSATSSFRESKWFKNFLFVGKLDWYPNQDGLRWFLENVWPQAIALKPDLTLTIVGSGNNEWLKPYLGIPGIRMVGQVKSLEPYYQDCVATIVPIFYGSGTRVKAIESSLYAKPCISTQIGIEGTGLIPNVSYYQAHSPNDWVSRITAMVPEEADKIGANAQKHALEYFNPDSIAGKFIQTVSVTQ